MVERFILFAIALLVLLAAGPHAMAVEEPPYTILSADGPIEVRCYGAQVIAEVDAEGSRAAAANDGFGPLAAYIFGANRPKAEIAMTAPVVQRRTEGQKIAMTAPVVQKPGAAAQAWTVRFIMPARYRLADLPAPNSPAVRLLEEPARMVAAIRFSGFASEGALARQADILRAFLAETGRDAAETPLYAFYNPPWTPPFLRRNEVWFELRDRC
jgi:hypothetical protein